MTDARPEAWAGDGGPVTTRVGDALIVTLPRELDAAALAALRTRVMAQLQRARAVAVIYEASGLELLDAAEFTALAEAARGAAWLGVRPLLVGLAPGLVRYVVESGLDTAVFEGFATLDDALASLGATATAGWAARPRATRVAGAAPRPDRAPSAGDDPPT